MTNIKGHEELIPVLTMPANIENIYDKSVIVFLYGFLVGVD